MSYKQKAINSTKWVTVSTVFQTALQFIQIAILARLLSPAAFGLVGISATVIAFFSTFANLGFSNSIIYKQETDQKVLSTVYLTNIGIGIIIFTLIYLSSPLIIAFYHEPRLDKVIKLTSLIFLIIYYGSVYGFMLQKELQFKSIAIIDILVNIIGTTVTITLAYRGYNEMSLVYGGLVTHVCRTVLLVYFGFNLFKPSLYFKLNEIKEHLRFGVFNLGEGLISFVQGNWDNIVIGSMLGAELLGYYTLAYQLAIFPVNKINPIILQVAYPVLAKMKENLAELKNSYIKILDLLTFFNLPLLTGLFITAESVVPLIYGPGWEPTFPLIKIFVLVSIFSCLSHPLFTLVYTKGKPQLLFYLNLVTLACKIPLVYVLGDNYGVKGIAIAFLLATLINMILNFFIVHSLIGSFLKQLLLSIYKPVLFCLLMVVTVYCYKSFVGYSGWFNAIAEIALGGIIYVALTLKYKFSFVELKDLKNSI